MFLSGEVDSEAFTQAILQFRNTPDPDNGMSPAEIIFSRKLRDTLPVKPNSQVFGNINIRPVWREIWRKREDTLKTRFAKQVETLEKTRVLFPLQVGDTCRIQNQTGHFPRKWDRTGRVVQVNGNDQYVVKVDGSGRLTLRNRKYLRQIQPLTIAPHRPNPTMTVANPHMPSFPVPVVPTAEPVSTIPPQPEAIQHSPDSITRSDESMLIP